MKSTKKQRETLAEAYRRERDAEKARADAAEMDRDAYRAACEWGADRVVGSCALCYGIPNGPTDTPRTVTSNGLELGHAPGCLWREAPIEAARAAITSLAEGELAQNERAERAKKERDEARRDAKHEKAQADHMRRGQSRCTRCEDRGETIRRLVAERDAATKRAVEAAEARADAVEKAAAAALVGGDVERMQLVDMLGPARLAEARTRAGK